MRKPRYRQEIKTGDPVERIIEAKQVLFLLDELITELAGMGEYASLLRAVLAKEYPSHGRAMNVVDGVDHSQRHYLARAHELRREYRQLIDDYQHVFGEVEIGKVPPLSPISVSFEEIASFEDRTRIWKDFLDG
jgi:hypothetical protein